jgi:hypothetical protein
MIAVLLVLSTLLLVGATVLFVLGGQRPQALQSGGLVMLVMAIILSTNATPPEPIPPTPDVTDYGGYRPHYQGHGTRTSGGRFGEIRRVNDAAGLVNAVRVRNGCNNTPETCARIIVFDASGNYSIGGQLTIDSPYLTMAGQTAPNDGVTLVNTRLLIDTNDVVIQHVKVRMPPRSLNACSIGDAGDGGDNSHVYNVVYDHVTCTWANEVNNLLVAGPGSHDVSILDSLVAEGLWPNSLGGIGAGIGYKNTVMRSVFSNHWSRQPIWGSPAELALINNVTYNGTDNTYGYDTLPAFYGDADGEGNAPGAEQTAIVNNVLIAGPNSGGVSHILGISKKQGSVDASAKIYMSGNQGPGITVDQWSATVCIGSYGTYPNAATCGPSSNMRTDTPFDWFTTYKFVVMPTNDVFNKVLENAGARPKNRDTADNRMISDIRNGTGTHFLSESSVQLPQLNVTTRACNLPSNPNEMVGMRTKIEEYLESDSTCGAQRLEVK